MAALRALLVDDESCVLESLAFLLEMEGFEIAGKASNLAGAVKLAGEAEADVAILDINLGRDLVYPAADLFAARDIPILFTSGCLSALPPRFSATTFIEKPYQPEILIAHIERLATNVQAMRLAAQRNLENLAARAFSAMAKGGSESLSESLRARPKG
jgi:DNA-binding NarL/FixJ family response regulator